MNSVKTCEICSTPIKGSVLTCSRKCADELKKRKNREIRICVCCGESFEVKKTLPNKLCSDKCRKDWANKEENKKNRIESSIKSNKEKYGGKHFFETEEFFKKSKDTKKEKYGDENYVNFEKAYLTKQEKYGDGNYNNSLKNKNTKKEKYGDDGYNNREKAKQTNLNKYGVDVPLRLSEFQIKQQNSNLSKIGYKFPIQNPKIKEKIRNKNINKWGFENPSQHEDVKSKIKSSILSNFSESNFLRLIKSTSLELLDEYRGIRYKKKDGGIEYYNYHFRCQKCSNEFFGTFSNNRVPICRICYPIHKNNKIHQELVCFFQNNEINFFENIRNVIKPYELDFYFPEQKLAIELNGNYYHSELGGGKDKNYHLNKSKQSYKLGIKLIHIFEDEWIFKRQIVESMLLNVFGKTQRKIQARKCRVEEVDNKKAFEFLEQNHIQGGVNSQKAFGLYCGQELVSIICFDQKVHDKWELKRFCSILNTNVLGGFSKLFKHFLNQHQCVTVKTFADCRWSGLDPNTTVYSKNGFTFVGNVKPRYFYIRRSDYLKRYHRFSFNKKRLLKLSNEKDHSLNEWSLAQGLNFDRIWDCGKLSFKYIKN